jgi:hypothetical protein
VGHALKGSWGANLVQYFSESRHGTVRDVGFAPIVLQKSFEHLGEKH